MRIRAATIDDANTLFIWRNDPATCAMSRHAAPVEWDKHAAWLASRLARPEPHLYIAELDGVPLGTFRIDGDEISYTVAPEARGKGIGLRMLLAAKARFGQLRAEIFQRNAASIKIASRAGMLVHILEDA